MTADPVRSQETLRGRIAEAIAERFTSPTRTAQRNGRSYDPETFETYTEPVPMSERIESGAFVSFIAADGGMSFRAATGYELADAVLPIVEEETKTLTEENETLRLANATLGSSRPGHVAELKAELAALRDKVKALADEWERQGGAPERGLPNEIAREWGAADQRQVCIYQLRALVEEPQGGERQ